MGKKKQPAAIQIGILKYRHMEKRVKITGKKSNQITLFLSLKNYKKVPITLLLLKNMYVQSISIQYLSYSIILKSRNGALKESKNQAKNSKPSNFP